LYQCAKRKVCPALTLSGLVGLCLKGLCWEEEEEKKREIEGGGEKRYHGERQYAT
jgi:hypothetical protein